MLQKYAYVPGVLNVCRKVWPGSSCVEVQGTEPSGSSSGVIVWALSPVFDHVTVAPAVTVSWDGTNDKPTISTVGPVFTAAEELVVELSADSLFPLLLSSSLHATNAKASANATSAPAANR
jgi:hypothetical protein